MNRRQVFQFGGPGMIAIALAGLSASARASPPEVFSEIALHPTDPGRLVLAYSGGGQGLLFSDDGGRHLRLRCGAAVEPELTQSHLPLALTADGLALLGTFDGLVQGGADGCGFDAARTLPGVQIADFAPHPLDPRILFVAIVEAGRGRVLQREPDGSLHELSSFGPADAGADAWLIDRVRVAALSEGQLRLYASGLRAEADDRYAPVLRRSDDGGASWTTIELPSEDGARLLLLAVDPTNPDRLALSLQRSGARDALLISVDGGASFEQRLDVHALGGVAVAPDGRLWVGDAGGDAEYSQPGALYVFDDFAATARALASWPVRCLGYRASDAALVGCTRSEIGDVDPQTGGFTRRAAFQTVDSFVRCGDEDLAGACERQLCDNWCGVLHYAQATVCDAYDGQNPVCGPAARGYGAAPASNLTTPSTGAEIAPKPVEPAPAAAGVPAPELAPGAATAGCAFAPNPSGGASAGVTLCALAAWIARPMRRRRARHLAAPGARGGAPAPFDSLHPSCHAPRVQRHS